ncbi:MAG: hypothetical protein HYS98_03615, partial [Deltaproteobacteria bacterium]|nr:hypothetical protein [Deltaproteobacteria bacterium]
MKVKILGVFLSALCLSLAFIFLYQHRSYIDPIDPPEEKIAFEVSDPDPQVTKKIPFKVLNIYPHGKAVSKVSQISISFNKPVVALEDFAKAALSVPIEISPSVNCQWRWLNRSTLSCFLGDPLPQSTDFQVKINKSLSAYDGTILASDFTGSFQTQNWKVVHHEVQWIVADKPEISIIFNQPMNVESLKENIDVKCEEKKIQKKEISIFPPDQVQGQDDYKGDVGNRRFQINFEKSLGQGRSCNLAISEKAKAQEGSLMGSAYALSFQTYPAFTVSKIQCQRGIEMTPDKGTHLKGCDPD